MTPYTKKALIVGGCIAVILMILNVKDYWAEQDEKAEIKALLKERRESKQVSPSNQKKVAAATTEKIKSLEKEAVELVEKSFKNFSHSFEEPRVSGTFDFETFGNKLQEMNVSMNLLDDINLSDQEIIMGARKVLVSNLSGKIYLKSKNNPVSLLHSLSEEYSHEVSGTLKASVAIGETRNILPCDVKVIFSRSAEMMEFLGIEFNVSRGELELAPEQVFDSSGESLATLAFKLKKKFVIRITENNELIAKKKKENKVAIESATEQGNP